MSNESAQPQLDSNANVSTEDVENQIVGEDAENEEVESSEEESSSEESAQEQPKMTEAEKKSLIKKLKLKVDGQEIEEEINLEDEETLKKHLQKAKAFDKRAQEYASLKNQVDEFIRQLQSNPESILEKMGFDVDELAKARLAKKVEELSKSPEELEKERMRQELETLREEKKRIEEEKRRAELEKIKNQHAAQIEADIQQALDDVKSILPKNNPKILGRIAEGMMFAMKNGFPRVTAKDVIPMVEKQYKAELKELFDVIPEETIESLVGKNNLERLRKKRLGNKPKVTAPVKQIKETGVKSSNQERKDKKQVKLSDLFNYFED